MESMWSTVTRLLVVSSKPVIYPYYVASMVIPRRVGKSLSTIGGEERGCNKFVPVLGVDDTKIAPLGDFCDQPPCEVN